MAQAGLLHFTTALEAIGTIILRVSSSTVQDISRTVTILAAWVVVMVAKMCSWTEPVYMKEHEAQVQIPLAARIHADLDLSSQKDQHRALYTCCKTDGYLWKSPLLIYLAQSP